MNGAEKIMTLLPKDFKVLDVGSLGLLGQNTTHYLLEHFGDKNVTGICLQPKLPENFLTEHPDFKFIEGDVWEQEGQYDLVVTDFGIEGNLQEWSNDGLEKIKRFIEPGGYLLNYVMTTTEYGDPLLHPHLLRKHWAEWWKQLPPHPEAIGRKLKDLEDWELVVAEQETRRPYIIWILLKLK